MPIKNGPMQYVLPIAAAGEAITGLALAADPSIVVRLLFGADIAGAGVVVSRVAGISLIALGVACWPGVGSGRAFCGMLTYSALVTLYLVYVGLGGQWVGALLWPAVVIHAVMTILLARAWQDAKNSLGQGGSTGPSEPVGTP